MSIVQRESLDLAYLQEIGQQTLEQAVRLYQRSGRGLIVLDLRPVDGRRPRQTYLGEPALRAGGWPEEWIDMVRSYAPDTQCVVMLVRYSGVAIYQIDGLARAA